MSSEEPALRAGLRLTFTPQRRRKMLVHTLGYLLTIYAGDEAAMYQAIADYRANPTKVAVKSPPIGLADQPPTN
jgi:hypothetical protein